MQTRIGCLFFFVLTGYCQAQTNLATLTMDYASAVSNLDTACETQKADALAAYGRTLDTLLTDLTQPDELKNRLVIEQEKTRLEAEKTVVEDENQNSDLLLAGKTYRTAVAKAEQDRNTRTVALTKQYVVRLESLIAQLTMQGNTESAAKHGETPQPRKNKVKTSRVAF